MATRKNTLNQEIVATVRKVEQNAWNKDRLTVWLADSLGNFDVPISEAQGVHIGDVVRVTIEIGGAIIDTKAVTA